MPKPKRIPAEQDLPTNAAELRAAAIREACEAAVISIDQFQAQSAAGQFAAMMLAHVPTGGRAFCVHGKLGGRRANTIIGRYVKESGKSKLEEHHPGWPARAQRKARKLLAVWNETEGKAP